MHKVVIQNRIPLLLHNQHNWILLQTLWLLLFWNNGFPCACSGIRSFAWNSIDFFLWAAFQILANASRQMWSGRDVVWIFVYHFPDWLHPFWKSFVQLRKSCETRPRIWQISIRVDIQICKSWPDEMKNSVAEDMILFSARTNELSVHYDDDKWNLLKKNSFRASAWSQKSLLIPSSSFLFPQVVKLFPIAMEILRWDSLFTVDSRLRLGSWNS